MPSSPWPLLIVVSQAVVRQALVRQALVRQALVRRVEGTPLRPTFSGDIAFQSLMSIQTRTQSTCRCANTVPRRLVRCELCPQVRDGLLDLVVVQAVPEAGHIAEV